MGLSNIQWTDYTFNPWIGCRKVADECKNCYAETLDKNRFSKTMPGCSKEAPISHWGSGPRYRTSESNWREPLKWNRKAGMYPDQCKKCGTRLCMVAQIQIGNETCPNRKDGVKCEGEVALNVRSRVFCASLSDWLDDENLPIEWLADLLRLIYSTPHLDWLLLTKRPQNWRSRIGLAHDSMQPSEERAWISRWVGSKCLGVTPEPPANVWIGVSAGADQAAALAIPARIHFLSCEPMLRPLRADMTNAHRFDWIIFGGESGRNARELNMQWIRDGVEFCRNNGIAPFVKQMGSNCVDREPGRAGMPLKFKDSYGGNMEEWPEDLRIREFPKL